MPGPKPVELKLNDETRNALEKLINGHKTSQQIALRAKIIKAAVEGKSNSIPPLKRQQLSIDVGSFL